MDLVFREYFVRFCTHLLKKDWSSFLLGKAQCDPFQKYARYGNWPLNSLPNSLDNANQVNCALKLPDSCAPEKV